MEKYLKKTIEIVEQKKEKQRKKNNLINKKKRNSTKEFLLGRRLKVKTEEGSWRKVSPSLEGSCYTKKLQYNIRFVHFRRR